MRFDTHTRGKLLRDRNYKKLFSIKALLASELDDSIIQQITSGKVSVPKREVSR